MQKIKKLILLLLFLTVTPCYSYTATPNFKLKLNNPYEDFTSNSYLLFSLNNYFNQRHSGSLWDKTMSMSITSFMSFIAHEMGHLYVGRKFGTVESDFPYATKKSRYIPTTDQYILETSAGPNQQELSAYIFWKNSTFKSNFHNSYAFLLNKLTDIGYQTLLYNVNYWDRGYTAPYEHYNVFGDFKFYTTLLNRNNINITRQSLLIDNLIADALSVPVWDHLSFWYNSLWDDSSNYSPTILKFNNTLITPPLLSLYMHPEGTYYIASTLLFKESDKNKISEINIGFPSFWNNYNKIKQYRIGGQYYLKLSEKYTLIPFIHINWNERKVNGSSSGIKIKDRINKHLTIQYQVKKHQNDIFENDIQHRYNGWELSILLSF